MKIRILDAAKEDMRETWKFYERQSPGLGDYFLQSIQEDVKSLLGYAGIHQIVAGYHRKLGKTFPFAIYYLIAIDAIEIYAVLDCRRDPNWIVRRLHSNPAAP